MGWTFLTNHAHALLAVAQDPGVRIEEIATRVGITQRAAHRIVTELADEGYITRTKVGRRIRYTVHSDTPLRHPMDQAHDVGELLAVLTNPPNRARGQLGMAPPSADTGRQEAKHA